MKHYFTRLITVSLLTLAGATGAWATEATVDGSQSRETDHSKTLAKKHDTSHGADIETSIEMSAIFLPVLKDLERKGVQPFARCNILTRPKLARDFGLSANVAPGVFDTIKAEYLKAAAEANAPLAEADADEEGLRRYIGCLGFYGAVVAQAFTEVAATGPIPLTMADARTVAVMAIHKVMATGLNKSLLAKYRAILSDKDECRFAGSLTEVQCGGSLVHIAGQPKLVTSGMVEWFGDNGKFAGLSGSFKITGNSSTSEAATIELGQKWNKSQTSKTGVSANKFLPEP